MKTRPLAVVITAGLIAPLACLVGCAGDDTDEPYETAAATPVRYEPGQPNMRTGWIPGDPVEQQSGEEFIRQAALSNMAELSASELALEQSSSEDVRQFAQRMVQDHTMMQDNVAQVAREQSIGMPLGPSMLEQQTLQRLAGFEGDRFDREYILQQIDAHQRAISLHEQHARQGGNPSVQALAQQSLPILRDHLREAQQIQSRLGITPGATGVSPAQGDADPQSRPVRLDPSQQPAPERREFISPQPATSPR